MEREAKLFEQLLRQKFWYRRNIRASALMSFERRFIWAIEDK